MDNIEDDEIKKWGEQLMKESKKIIDRFFPKFEFESMTFRKHGEDKYLKIYMDKK